jgi:glycosyltransferase involved in cell wall biosynthesis
MGQGPLVSIVAGCYNHARFVVDCLESIRGQTYDNVEVVIIDDHSTDNSVDIIDEWLRTTGVQATVLVNDQNLGICRTRNRAIAHLTGKYCAFVSTDDTWLPDKLERHVKEMEALPDDVALLYTDAYRMDESGAPLPGMFLEHYLPDREPPSGDVYEVLLDGNFIPSLTTLVRRSALQAVGPYDESLSFEDWDMWLRIAQRFKFMYLDAPAARYRVVATSLDHALRGPRRAAFDASKVRIQLKHHGYSPAFDRLLGFRTLEYLRSLYQLGHPERDAYVDEVVQAGRRHGLRWMAFLARWVVPHAGAWSLTLAARAVPDRARTLARRIRRRVRAAA